MTDGAGLRMRDVVERSGVGEATIRAWESRYGFPEPRRLPSGHRRYAASDVTILRHALELRDAGLPLKDAIARAREAVGGPSASIYAELRRQRPDLQVNVLPKKALVAICHAIEDESAYGAGDLLLFGAFQRERHYRDSERRWRELSRAAEAAVVFADFAAVRRPRGAPVEVPIGARDPWRASGRSSATRPRDRPAWSGGSSRPAGARRGRPSGASRPSGPPIARPSARPRGSAAGSRPPPPTSPGRSKRGWPSRRPARGTSSAAPRR